MIKMTDKGRTEPRVAARVPVEIVTRQGDIVAETMDVSRSGAKLVATGCWRERELIRLRFYPGGEEVELMAVVVRRTVGDSGEEQLGVSFYANDTASVERWGEYVEGLSDDDPTALEHHIQRVITSDDISELFTQLNHDLRRGETFWPTRRALRVGAKLDVMVEHPMDGSRFKVTAEVVKEDVQADEQGVWVRLEADGRDFLRFLDEGFPWAEVADQLEQALEDGEFR